MSGPNRGEVWQADLGMAAKVRPVLVVSVPITERDYALVQVIPHTTQKRGASFEVDIQLPFLQPGVFNLQGMLAVPLSRFVKKLGVLNQEQMAVVEAGG